MATTPNRATRRSSTTKPKASSSTTAKKTTAPKPKKNEAAVTLADIDAEASEVVSELEGAEPFVIAVGDDEDGNPVKITLSHPALMSYEIVSSGDQDAVLAAAMNDEDYEKFLDMGLNTIQAGVVFVMWRKHYGVGSQGE